MTNVEEKKVRNVLKGETFEGDETARRVFFAGGSDGVLLSMEAKVSD